MDYAAYIESAAWRERRDERIRAVGGRCQLCNGGGELHVHHRTYARVGREFDSDLTVLCVGCHEKYHDILPGRIEETPAARKPLRQLHAHASPEEVARLRAIDTALESAGEAEQHRLLVEKQEIARRIREALPPAPPTGGHHA